AKMTRSPPVIDHGIRSTGTPSGRITSTDARARQACAAEAETVAMMGGLSDPRLSARAAAIAESGGRCSVCTTGDRREEARRMAGGSKAWLCTTSYAARRIDAYTVAKARSAGRGSVDGARP